MTEQQNKIRDVTAFVGDILEKLRKRQPNETMLCVDCSCYPTTVIDVVKRMLAERNYIVMVSMSCENSAEKMYIFDKKQNNLKR